MCSSDLPAKDAKIDRQVELEKLASKMVIEAVA